MHFQIAHRAEVSPVRTESSDAIHVDEARGWIVLGTGVGFVNNPEAGRVAVASTVTSLETHDGPLDEDALENVVRASHATLAAPRVVVRNKRKRTVHGDLIAMLDLVALVDGAALLAHVGSHRAYVVREGEARCVTTDHTMAQATAGPNVPVPRDARFRKVLTSAIGGDGLETIDTLRVPLAPGDQLLLCNDGVYDGVYDDAELAACAATGLDAMVDSLLARNVRDNIAAVLITVR